jgi:hypothetical protein
MPTGAGALTAPWAALRGRAETLRAQYPFAREILALYEALVAVQERVHAGALAERVRPEDAAGYAASRALPLVVEATEAYGPQALARAVRERTRAADGPEMGRGWLVGADQPPVDRYLARAASVPVLEALGEAAGQACQGRRDDRHCPRCGGPPQVSVLSPGSEGLAGVRRSLICARCGAWWPYPRMTCAACGERDAAHLVVYAEDGTAEAETSGNVVRGLDGGRRPLPSGPEPRFPHIRVEACRTCSRYVLAVDLSRDPRAVPVVDEMAALPLDLYAQERGLTKIVPNLMGV